MSSILPLQKATKQHDGHCASTSSPSHLQVRVFEHPVSLLIQKLNQRLTYILKYIHNGRVRQANSTWIGGSLERDVRGVPRRPQWDTHQRQMPPQLQ
jgi:hypothetical protein